MIDLNIAFIYHLLFINYYFFFSLFFFRFGPLLLRFADKIKEISSYSMMMSEFLEDIRECCEEYPEVNRLFFVFMIL